MGARALCKHAHRSTEGFWGKVSGKEKHKNELAEKVLQQILDECVWVNLHILPHEQVIVEIRIAKGYGARWTADGGFRGFLEPLIEGGHEKKWRH